MSVNTCVHCGEIIPEGGMACWSCKHGIIKMGSILQSMGANVDEVEDAYSFIHTNPLKEEDEYDENIS